MIRADLHLHTVYSDGEKTPLELLQMLKAEGVQFFSFTDHDVSPDHSELSALAREQGMTYIPGVEFTTYDREQIHILGYGYQRTPAFLQRLAIIREQRERRNLKILSNLKKVGVEISPEEIDHNASGFYGTLQIIRAMVKKGYVPDYPAGMRDYFATDGPGYVGSERISPHEAVRLITQSGGVAVLAHPGKMKTFSLPEQREMIATLKEEGLGGIECYYSSHTESETARYLEWAKEFQLLPTVGSDFHGVERPEHVGRPIHFLTQAETERLCGKNSSI